MFNALKYTQELENAGFSRNEAEASLKILIEVMNDNFATKSDLKELELRMDHRFQVQTQTLESKIQTIEYRLTIKLGTLMALSIGLTATLLQLMK
jgi:hypothetical protein